MDKTVKKEKPKKVYLGMALTESEKVVLSLVSANKSTRQIAEELQISGKTVENHRGKICKKLGLTGNAALLRYALQKN